MALNLTGKSSSGDRPITPGHDLSKEGLGGLIGMTVLHEHGGPSEPTQAGVEGYLLGLLLGVFDIQRILKLILFLAGGSSDTISGWAALPYTRRLFLTFSVFFPFLSYFAYDLFFCRSRSSPLQEH